jgi:hypothetical protein
MRIRLFVLTAFVAALMSTALAAGAYAQSLGELAKQEEARRKAIRGPAKVYTNESLRPESRQTSPTAPPPAAQQPAATPPSSSGATPPSPSGQAPGTAQPGKPTADTAATTAPDPKQDEAAWRNRIRNERELLQRAQTFAEALQSRINALTADFAARDDPAQRAQVGVDRQKALAELDRVKQEIQQHTKAIASIQEEARKAGVPPGWVR